MASLQLFLITIFAISALGGAPQVCWRMASTGNGASGGCKVKAAGTPCAPESHWREVPIKMTGGSVCLSSCKQARQVFCESRDCSKWSLQRGHHCFKAEVILRTYEESTCCLNSGDADHPAKGAIAPSACWSKLSALSGDSSSCTGYAAGISCEPSPNWRAVDGGRCLPSCKHARQEYCKAHDCSGLHMERGNRCMAVAYVTLESYEEGACCLAR